MHPPHQQPPYPGPQRQTVKRGANHGLHIFLTICTCGLWAITGWPIAAAMGRKETTVIQPQPGQWQGQQPLPPASGYGAQLYGQQAPAPGWQAPPPGATPPPGYGYSPQQRNPYADP